MTAEDFYGKPILGAIYLITNKVNGKIYVGQNQTYDKTLVQIQKYMGSGRLLKRAQVKYGIENFSKDYIDFGFTQEELNVKEKLWIEKLNARDPKVGYNLAIGGQRDKDSEVQDFCVKVVNEQEAKVIRKSQLESYLQRGYSLVRFKEFTSVCYINDGVMNYKVSIEELKDLLAEGFLPGRMDTGNTRETWMQLNNQAPKYFAKKSVTARLAEGYCIISDCPVCHAPNSADNFCCSDEHWDEFERLRKEAMSRAQSEFVSSSWKDESVAEARKAGVSSAFAKRREMREAGELDAYVWVKNDSLGVESQVPESDVSEYEESGYVRGRLGFSAEARANMGRDAGFSWSEESLRKREETRQKLHEERMKDPKYVKEQHDLRSVGQLKASEKKKGTWANKEMSDDWRRMKSETTKAGFAKKKAEALAAGECVTKKWVHRGTESVRVLETEYAARLADGWEPGRGKMGEFKKHKVTRTASRNGSLRLTSFVG